MGKEYVQTALEKQIHQKLKIQAVKADCTMNQYLATLLQKAEVAESES